MPAQIESHPPEAATVPPSPLLSAKLAGLRRKLVRVAVLTGLAVLVIIGVELLALMLLMDWWLELPWGVRLVSFLGQAGFLGWLCVRLIARPLWRQPDDDALALRVEKARPEFRSRLIAAVQLTRPGAIPPGASAAMVEAMIEQTEAMAAPVDFQAIVPDRRLKRLGALAAGLLLLALAVLFIGHATTFDLLKRAGLANTPVPRKTRVLVPEGGKTLGRGDAVRLEAIAQGVIPAAGKLILKSPRGMSREYPLEPNRQKRAAFARTLENVQDSFDYQIRLNDGVSPWYHVKVISRPAVAALVCEQDFPPYTGLKPMRRFPGDLSLLAGSRLRLSVTATKDLQSASLKCAGLDRTVPLQISGPNRRQLSGELLIPASGLQGFTIRMRDTDGMESRDSVLYRVEILPDKPPVARLTHPERKEELVTRQATLILGMDILDDFAVNTVRLRYKTDSVDHGAEKTVELDLQGEHSQRVRRRHEWKLGAFNPPLKEGSRVEYWIEAADNNNATGPGVGASEHQFLKVVSQEEKRADLLNRAGDYLGGISDVAGNQEKLNRNLGAIITEKALPP